MFKLATEYMQGAAEWVQSRYVQYSNIANKFGFDPELTVVHPFDPWKDSWAGRFITNSVFMRSDTNDVSWITKYHGRH